MTPYWLSSGSQLILGASVDTSNTNFENNLDLDGTTQTINVVHGAANTTGVDGQLSGVVSDGALAVVGNGTLQLTGANSYTGGTTVSSGTLQIGNGTSGSINSAGTLTVASGATLAFDESTGSTISSSTITDNGTVVGAEGAGIMNTLTSTISGTGGFNQTGAGTTIFGNSAANSPYSGATQLTSGVLVAGHTGVLAGGFASNTTGTSNIVFAGGVLGMGYNNNTFTRALGTGTSQVQFTSGANGGFANYNGPYSATQTINIGGSSATLIYGSTQYWLSSGSQLILGAAGANGATIFQNGLDLAGTTQTIDVVRGTGTYDGQLSGVITDGALAVTGNGLLQLTAANTYTGGTTVSSGTLLANSSDTTNGSTGSGLVTVKSGGILGGGAGTTAGVVKGGITVNSGRILTAGAGATTGAPGILNANTTSTTVTLASGSIFDVKVNGVGSTGGTGGGAAVAGTNWDQVQMYALSVTSAATINLYGLTANNVAGATPGFSSSTPFNLIVATLANVTQSTLSADIASGDFVLNTSNFTNNNSTPYANTGFQLVALAAGGGSDLEISYTASPEPGTAMLVLGGAVPMLMNRRRRRR